MTTKKNPEKMLEKHRGLFFLIGLAAALGLVVFAMQYKTKLAMAEKPRCELPVENTATFEIPRTILEWPKPEVKKKVNYTLEPRVTVEKKTVEKPEPEDKKLEPLVGDPIGFEDPDLDKVETVTIYVVERIARPFSCEDLDERQAQMECLNHWVKQQIQQNVKYPAIAKRMHEEERIWVELTISELGNIENARVVKGENRDLKEEALRVINNLPPLVPASQQGRPVKMKFTVPVTFKLQ